MFTKKNSSLPSVLHTRTEAKGFGSANKYINEVIRQRQKQIFVEQETENAEIQQQKQQHSRKNLSTKSLFAFLHKNTINEEAEEGIKQHHSENRLLSSKTKKYLNGSSLTVKVFPSPKNEEVQPGATDEEEKFSYSSFTALLLGKADQSDTSSLTSKRANQSSRLTYESSDEIEEQSQGSNTMTSRLDRVKISPKSQALQKLLGGNKGDNIRCDFSHLISKQPSKESQLLTASSKQECKMAQEAKKSMNIHLAMKIFDVEKDRKQLHTFEKDISVIKDKVLSPSSLNFKLSEINSSPISTDMGYFKNNCSFNNKNNNSSQLILNNSRTQSNSNNQSFPEQMNLNNQSTSAAVTHSSSIMAQKTNSKSYIKEFLEKDDNLSQKMNESSKPSLLIKRDNITQDIFQTFNQKINGQNQLHFSQNPEVFEILEQLDSEKSHTSRSDLMKVIKQELHALVGQTSSKTEYRFCSDREESRSLNQWLNEMMQKVIANSSNHSLTKVFAELEIILYAGWAELVRQVSQGCQERGDIMDQIWRQFNYLITKLFAVHCASSKSSLTQTEERARKSSLLLQQLQDEMHQKISILQEKLRETEECLRKVSESNLYLRKKLNKIEKEKYEIQNDYVDLEHVLNDQQAQHVQLINQVCDFDNALQKEFEKKVVSQEAGSNDQTKEYQIFNEYPRQHQGSIELVRKNDNIEQQREIMNNVLKQSKSIQLTKQQEVSQCFNSKTEVRIENYSFKSIHSLENEIFIQNQEDKNAIEAQAIISRSMNTSFRFFLDNVDAATNTPIVGTNNAETQCYFEEEFVPIEIRNEDGTVNMTNTQSYQNQELFLSKKLKEKIDEIAEILRKPKPIIIDIRTRIAQIQDMQNNLTNLLISMKTKNNIKDRLEDSSSPSENPIQSRVSIQNTLQQIPLTSSKKRRQSNSYDSQQARSNKKQFISEESSLSNIMTLSSTMIDGKQGKLRTTSPNLMLHDGNSPSKSQKKQSSKPPEKQHLQQNNQIKGNSSNTKQPKKTVNSSASSKSPTGKQNNNSNSPVKKQINRRYSMNGSPVFQGVSAQPKRQSQERLDSNKINRKYSLMQPIPEHFENVKVKQNSSKRISPNQHILNRSQSRNINAGQWEIRVQQAGSSRESKREIDQLMDLVGEDQVEDIGDNQE